MNKPIYIDVMSGERFLKQMPYFISSSIIVNGNMEQVLDAQEISEYVYSKIAILERTGRYKNRIFKPTNY